MLTYASAVWNKRQRFYDFLQAASERVTVSQISGAMTNLVYRCDYDTPAKVGQLRRDLTRALAMLTV